MPWIERIISDFNRALNGYPLSERAEVAQMFEPGKPLREGLESMGVVTQDRQLTALHEWPRAFSAAFRGAIHEFLANGSDGPITIAWAPGYDYELTVWESTGVQDSAGGLTILVKTRYPFDRHPAQRGVRNGGAAAAS